ncbi:hypothetical protein EDEG_00162 [Edhazardia aedis USNM 41457]|uniref:Uncharacterized protein n=1 Tax=Edhazardia aedis (strain USNM 41457) TaxID=1003232 RepID=J9DQX2_EDHAE|nr:hypothetical protein EDEG_00162 [Edhazardia aedis USNM 41457]|eukprot:EJW03722.1 hypothetical protein EDEG_00162 [Edhazardia aedis USNM 41457]
MYNYTERLLLAWAVKIYGSSNNEKIQHFLQTRTSANIKIWKKEYSKIVKESRKNGYDDVVKYCEDIRIRQLIELYKMYARMRDDLLDSKLGVDEYLNDYWVKRVFYECDEVFGNKYRKIWLQTEENRELNVNDCENLVKRFKTDEFVVSKINPEEKSLPQKLNTANQDILSKNIDSKLDVATDKSNYLEDRKENEHERIKSKSFIDLPIYHKLKKIIYPQDCKNPQKKVKIISAQLKNEIITLSQDEKQFLTKKYIDPYKINDQTYTIFKKDSQTPVLEEKSENDAKASESKEIEEQIIENTEENTKKNEKNEPVDENPKLLRKFYNKMTRTDKDLDDYIDKLSDDYYKNTEFQLFTKENVMIPRFPPGFKAINREARRILLNYELKKQKEIEIDTEFVVADTEKKEPEPVVEIVTVPVVETVEEKNVLSPLETDFNTIVEKIAYRKKEEKIKNEWAKELLVILKVIILRMFRCKKDYENVDENENATEGATVIDNKRSKSKSIAENNTDQNENRKIDTEHKDKKETSTVVQETDNILNKDDLENHLNSENLEKEEKQSNKYKKESLHTSIETSNSREKGALSSAVSCTENEGGSDIFNFKVKTIKPGVMNIIKEQRDILEKLVDEITVLSNMTNMIFNILMPIQKIIFLIEDKDKIETFAEFKRILCGFYDFYRK